MPRQDHSVRDRGVVPRLARTPAASKITGAPFRDQEVTPGTVLATAGLIPGRAACSASRASAGRPPPQLVWPGGHPGYRPHGFSPAPTRWRRSLPKCGLTSARPERGRRRPLVRCVSSCQNRPERFSFAALAARPADASRCRGSAAPFLTVRAVAPPTRLLCLAQCLKRASPRSIHHDS